MRLFLLYSPLLVQRTLDRLLLDLDETGLQ